MKVFYFINILGEFVDMWWMGACRLD